MCHGYLTSLADSGGLYTMEYVSEMSVGRSTVCDAHYIDTLQVGPVVLTVCMEARVHCALLQTRCIRT